MEGRTLSNFEPLMRSRAITIIHPYSQPEIETPTFGGTRLIAEQISYLEELGKEVKVVSLGEVGSLTSFLYRLHANLRRRARNKATNTHGNYDSHSEKSRWWLNLIQVLINEYSAKIDLLYRFSINKLIGSLPDEAVIIYHYPYGARYFATCAKKKHVKFVLYQHNIEWKFFEDRLDNGLIQRMLLSKARTIELGSVGCADLVAFASERDRMSLKDDVGKTETVSWLPVVRKSAKKPRTPIPGEIADKIARKVVVGFLGTNFEPNIVAVENIITLARNSSDSLVFLIIGSVNRAFRQRNDIPGNVVFTGYVEELDSYLSQCDVFINPKTTSDTGIETKMFDYMKFDKYVVSTESGAIGFDSNEKVVISTMEQMLTTISSFHVIGGNRL